MCMCQYPPSSSVLGIGLSLDRITTNEGSSPLSIEVVIVNGSLEHDVTASVSAFSGLSDTATEGKHITWLEYIVSLASIWCMTTQY